MNNKKIVFQQCKNISYAKPKPFFFSKEFGPNLFIKMTCLKCYVNTYKICESPTNTLATDTSFPVESTLTLPLDHTTTYTTEAMSSTSKCLCIKVCFT